MDKIEKTLLDLGVWVAGLAIIVGFVVVIVNPHQRVGLIRNAERRLVVENLERAVVEFEKLGALEGFEEPKDVCDKDFCVKLVEMGLLDRVPKDPTGSGEGVSGYQMVKTSGGVKILAPHAEEGEKIERSVEF